MPPKKPSSPKKDGGKKKGKKDEALEENKDPNSEAAGASVEELLNRISALELEKNKEEEYRNYMQLERVSHTLPLLECCNKASLSHVRKRSHHYCLDGVNARLRQHCASISVRTGTSLLSCSMRLSDDDE